jgi:hypothetical protein
MNILFCNKINRKFFNKAICFKVKIKSLTQIVCSFKAEIIYLKVFLILSIFIIVFFYNFQLVFINKNE